VKESLGTPGTFSAMAMTTPETRPAVALGPSRGMGSTRLPSRVRGAGVLSTEEATTNKMMREIMALAKNFPPDQRSEPRGSEAA